MTQRGECNGLGCFCHGHEPNYRPGMAPSERELRQLKNSGSGNRDLSFPASALERALRRLRPIVPSARKPRNQPARRRLSCVPGEVRAPQGSRQRP